MFFGVFFDLLNSWGLSWTILLALSCLAVFQYLQSPANLPPGPWGWPVVGNLLSLRKATPLVLTEWAKEYGDIVSYRTGSELRVVLNSYDVVREAFVKKFTIFSSRPKPLTSFIAQLKTKGIVSERYGPTWKDHRRFSMKSLRDFGSGKKSLEGKILEEARALVGRIAKREHQEFSIDQMIQGALSNVIASIAFGTRYEDNDPEFEALLSFIDETFSTSTLSLLPVFFPTLRYIPGVNSGLNRYDGIMSKVFKLFQDKIEDHKKDFKQDYIRDFIDAFLLEKMNREGDENTTFTEEQLAMIVADMFFAGTDTTSTTLRWALLYMILHPDIQEKVQQEIDSVIGPNNDPSMMHRSETPYTAAALAEVERLATIAPLALPHATTEETRLGGYNIPKGTIVEPNIWAIHHDPQLWPNPHEFDPTRFLDDRGKFVKREKLIPFSIGRRACLGEQLARMELYLFLTSLLQRFSFKLAEGAPIPSGKGEFGLTHAPMSYKLVAIPRNYCAREYFGS
ncbi:CYP2U1 [Branchiostoma lanceolatum]|uniref:Cytochrome P450 2U1 n=1 Tax=Branchiostoma lanceolatum TaxID=7740 RepID=A0A8K0A4X2_BRALA|nr:CYP2U1 [Branchiostoma lanceolatum]